MLIVPHMHTPASRAPTTHGQVQCRTGYLARAAGRNLQARGFEQIFVLGENAERGQVRIDRDI